MRRKKSTIDIEVQILVVGALILLVTLQSFMIAWGLNKAADIASQVARPDRGLAFFKIMTLVLTPIVALNAVVGTLIAKRISEPLNDIRLAMNEIAHGNLEQALDGEPGEFLSEYKLDCNRMAETLRQLIYRDRNHADEANELLSQCQKWLSHQKLKADDREKLETLLADAKSRLSIINDHFLRGKRAKI